MCFVLESTGCGPSPEDGAPAGITYSGGRVLEEGVEVLDAASRKEAGLAGEFPEVQTLPDFLFGVVVGSLADLLVDPSLSAFSQFVVKVKWEWEWVVVGEGFTGGLPRDCMVFVEEVKVV